MEQDRYVVIVVDTRTGLPSRYSEHKGGDEAADRAHFHADRLNKKPNTRAFVLGLRD